MNPTGFLGRIWLTLWQRAIILHVEERYQVVRISGAGWKGLALQLGPTLRAELEHRINGTITAEERMICADLSLGTRQRCDVLVFHVWDAHEINEVAETIVPRHHRKIHNPLGLFIEQYGAVIVTGSPQGYDFRECCAHEICHALLYLLTGATGRVPWSFEGYACLIADRIGGNKLSRS